MKKDRDSFFGQYGSYGYNNGPYMYPNMTNQNMNNQMYQNNDINERLNRIESEINNLNNRITKLESINTTTNNDFNFTNSMYMV